MHIVPISDPADARLRDYIALTDVSLRRPTEPQDGRAYLVSLLASNVVMWVIALMFLRPSLTGATRRRGAPCASGSGAPDSSVASSVWTLLAEPRSFEELRDALLNEYEVGEEECANELRTLLADLTARNLICNC